MNFKYHSLTTHINHEKYVDLAVKTATYNVSFCRIILEKKVGMMKRGCRQNEIAPGNTPPHHVATSRAEATYR